MGKVANPRVRVFTKSMDLIESEFKTNKLIPKSKRDFMEKFVLAKDASSTSTNNQINYFYNLR